MKNLLLLSLLFVSFQSRAENLCAVAMSKAAQLQDPPSAQWVLQWHDEFNTPGKPDPTLWKFEIGGSGWGNREDEYYTDRLENARVEDGKLIIEAHKEEFQNRHYTSARINSVAKVAFGKIEFRAKMPAGQGTWGAAWLLADKPIYGNGLVWPDNGEIDVLESIGHEPDANHMSLHSHNNSFFNHTQISTTFAVPNAATEFHDYTLEWLPESITLSVDGIVQLKRMRGPTDDWKQWPFDQNMYLIMNLAIGGIWGKEKGPIDDSIFPVRMEFEYVRVYRPSATNAGCYVGNSTP